MEVLMKVIFSRIAVCLSTVTLYGVSFAGGDWNPTGTSNTTQAIYRSGNTSTTGRVGVGMTSPGSKLQVNGNAAIGYSSSTAGPSNGLAVSGNVGIGTTSPSSKLDVNGDIHTSGNIFADAGITSGGLISTNTGFFCMAMNGGYAAHLWGPIKMDGNIGINQEPGTEALEIGGNIKCNAVKINNWTIEAPDYVFEKDYNLPSLSAVEKHIVIEKHLPGVPSAAEMKKNGVDLSEMNMTLLQKVEELTLYVIEQNKKIEALEKKVSVK